MADHADVLVFGYAKGVILERVTTVAADRESVFGFFSDPGHPGPAGSEAYSGLIRARLENAFPETE